MGEFKYLGPVIIEIVLIFFFIQSIFLFIYYRNKKNRNEDSLFFDFNKSYQPGFSSSLNASYFLLVYRILGFSFFCGWDIIANFVTAHNTDVIFLEYFTNWNILFITFYFLLSSICSIIGIYQINMIKSSSINNHHKWSNNVIYFGYFTQIIFEVAGGNEKYLSMLSSLCFIFRNCFFYYISGFCLFR